MISKNTALPLLLIALSSSALIYYTSLYHLETYRAIFGIQIEVYEIKILEIDRKNRTVIKEILNISNPSQTDVSIVGASGRLYLNKKYVGLIYINLDGEATLPPTTGNYTLFGMTTVMPPWNIIVLDALEKDELNWTVEGWLHVNVHGHTTIVEFRGEPRDGIIKALTQI